MIKRLSISLEKNMLFYVAWILMCIQINMANSSAAEFNTPIVSYIAILLFTIKIFWNEKYTVEQVVLVIALITIGVVSSVASSDMRVLWFAIVIAAAKGIDNNKVIKYTLATTVICCISFVALFFAGVTEQVVIVTGEGVKRYGCGLGHPNMCYAYFLIIMAMTMYLYYDKIKIMHCTGFTIIAILLYRVTGSRTGVIVTILAIIIMVVIKKFRKKKIYMQATFFAVLLGVAAFSLIPIFYNAQNAWLSEVNSMMSGRFVQAHYYYEKYGVALFGNNIVELSAARKNAFLDCGYAKLLINNGLIYYAIIVVGYISTAIHSIRIKQYNVIVLVYAMMIYLFTENVATYIFANVSMLFFAELVYGEKKYKIKIS